MFLIVAALPEESNEEFEKLEKLDCRVIYTGIGKVNAIVKVALELQARRKKPIKAIINLGSCASSRLIKHSVVQCGMILERDFYMPFEDSEPIYADTSGLDLPIVTCGTGDYFMSKEELLKWRLTDIVDMEAYALAKLAEAFSIPFYCLKSISDCGDYEEWREILPFTSVLLREQAEKLISDIN